MCICILIILIVCICKIVKWVGTIEGWSWSCIWAKYAWLGLEGITLRRILSIIIFLKEITLWSWKRGKSFLRISTKPTEFHRIWIKSRLILLIWCISLHKTIVSWSKCGLTMGSCSCIIYSKAITHKCSIWCCIRGYLTNFLLLNGCWIFNFVCIRRIHNRIVRKLLWLTWDRDRRNAWICSFWLLWILRQAIRLSWRYFRGCKLIRSFLLLFSRFIHSCCYFRLLFTRCAAWVSKNATACGIS